GTLGTGNLSITGSYEDEIDVGGGLADLLNVSGTVGLSNATLNLLAMNLPIMGGGGIYLLILNDGVDSVTGTFSTITGLPPDYTASIEYAYSGTDSLGRVGDGNDVAVTLIPEPGTFGVMLAAAGVAMARRRRKP
ncbi:MAG: PEP-CTERM sorting domain-containing protein, partial [Tepidisphaeraceae bacterium]